MKRTLPGDVRVRRLSIRAGSMGFVALLRSIETFDLLRDHRAFCLLAHCALRARTQEGIDDGLKLGQCLIGWPNTARELGMSRGEFDCARERLRSAGLISTATSKRGTVVTMLTQAIYDLGHSPQSQPRAQSNQQLRRQPRWH